MIYYHYSSYNFEYQLICSQKKKKSSDPNAISTRTYLNSIQTYNPIRMIFSFFENRSVDIQNNKSNDNKSYFNKRIWIEFG